MCGAAGGVDCKLVGALKKCFNLAQLIHHGKEFIVKFAELLGLLMQAG